MSKEPQVVLDSIYAFPPNRYTLGGTSYLIVKNQGNILIDCPIWDDESRRFLEQQGGVQYFILTHRGGISAQIAEIYHETRCELWIQEQEAYRLSSLPVKTFQTSHLFDSGDRILWTPGHSPGSSCFYTPIENGILFTGRHLLPNAQGHPQPLRTPKTFHWPRQLESIKTLLAEFSVDTLQYLLPGANTGLLRGKKIISNAYQALRQASTPMSEH